MPTSLIAGDGVKGVPAEILHKILGYVLILNRPISLQSDVDTANLDGPRNHLHSCTLGIHKHLFMAVACRAADGENLAVMSSNPYTQKFVYCEDPFTGVQRRVHFEKTVLELAMVCKGLKSIVLDIFFGCNEFRFRNYDEFHTASRILPRDRRNRIKIVSFAFVTPVRGGDYAFVKKFISLSKLRIFFDIKNRHIKLNKAYNLRTARGMSVLVETLENMKSSELVNGVAVHRGILSLEIAGTDRIPAASVSGSKARMPGRVVSANHRNAIGPWLRETVVNKQPWLAPKPFKMSNCSRKRPYKAITK